MARLADRHPDNVPGEWYVDDRCIDCDVARQHAPDLIVSIPGGQSIVTRQPATDEEELAMWRAALACPTRSIGTTTRRQAPAGVFPMEVAPGVHLCGHNDRRSFGAHVWVVPQPGDGFLVDAPHWDRSLIQAIEDAGGIRHVLLTHRDDIADAHRYAGHFGARVWIHEADRDAAPFATDIITTTDEVTIFPGMVAFAMPGHARKPSLHSPRAALVRRGHAGLVEEDIGSSCHQYDLVFPQGAATVPWPAGTVWASVPVRLSRARRLDEEPCRGHERPAGTPRLGGTARHGLLILVTRTAVCHKTGPRAHAAILGLFSLGGSTSDGGRGASVSSWR